MTIAFAILLAVQSASVSGSSFDLRSDQHGNTMFANLADSHLAGFGFCGRWQSVRFARLWNPVIRILASLILGRKCPILGMEHASNLHALSIGVE